MLSKHDTQHDPTQSSHILWETLRTSLVHAGVGSLPLAEARDLFFLPEVEASAIQSSQQLPVWVHYLWKSSPGWAAWESGDGERDMPPHSLHGHKLDRPGP